MTEVGRITLSFGEGNEATISILGAMSIQNASELMGRTIGAMLYQLDGDNTTVSIIKATSDYFKKGIATGIQEASEQ